MTASTRTVPTGKNPDLITTTILIEGKEIPKKYHIAGITVVLEINKIPSATLIILDGEPSEEDFKISDS